MSFRKNLFVLLCAVIVSLLCAWLVGVGNNTIISGMTLIIPTVAVTLSMEDLMRKLLNDRELLTWQYFLGDVFLVGAVITWFWASESIVVSSMFLRLTSTFLFCILCYLWFKFFYHKSITTSEDRMEEIWEKFRKKALLATKEDAFKLLANTLRYRVVDDVLSGDLDFDRPIGIYDKQCMTYSELLLAEDDNTGSLNIVRTAANDYIQALVINLAD